VAGLGGALESIVCGRKDLFTVDGELLRIKNPDERNRFREDVKRVAGRWSDCPREATDLAAALLRKQEHKDDVQQLIAALFVVRQPLDGPLEIIPRPKANAATMGADSSVPGASAPAADAGTPAPTGEGTPEPALPPSPGDTKTDGRQAGWNEEFQEPAGSNQQTFWKATPWWLVAGLLGAFLIAAALLLAALLSLVRTLRGFGGALDFGLTRIERSVRAMTIGDEKSILTGLTALVGVIRDARTSLQNIESRLERIELRLDRCERLMGVSAHPTAQVSPDYRPKPYEPVSEARTGYYASARPAPPIPPLPPARQVVDEDQVVDSFNSCLTSCQSSGRRSDASDLVQTFKLKEVFVDEDGKLDSNRNRAGVAMWLTQTGPDNEYLLIPTVRQVYDDLATLVGNGIEGAQRKLGVYFEVHETEKGTRHAVLERSAILSGLGRDRTKIKQKGLLRLPFGQ
jgi:hypothetical protein